jgi:phage-related protein
VVKLVWGQIQNVVETFVRIVRDVILVVLALINGDWGKAWDAIKDILAAAWTEIVGTVQFFLGLLWTIFGGALTAIGDAFSSTWQAITGTASAAWQALTSGASGAVDGIVGFFRALPGRILGLAGSILNAAVSIGGTIIDGLGQGLSKVASFVGDIAGAVASAIRSALHNLVQILNDAIPDHLGWGFLSVNLPHNPIPNPFHTGGVVPAGPDVNALLRGGEAVFTPDQMALLGQVISRGGGASTAAPVAGPAVLVQVDARGSTFTDLTVDRLAQRLSLRLNETLRSRQLEMNLRTGVRR